MAKRLNAATDLFEPVVVDLWGPEYSLLQPTRVVEEKMEAAQEKLNNLPSDSTDEATFAAICEVIDVHLEPLPDNEGVKPPRAKTHLKKKYKDKEIGISHVMQLMDALVEMRSERPT